MVGAEDPNPEEGVDPVDVECACCRTENPRGQVRPCRRGHVVCEDCKRRLNRPDCLFCTPHTVVQNREPGRPNPCVAASSNACPAVLKAALSFLTALYAGKVFVWLYIVTQDKPVAWFAWDSFRYCFQEAFLGLVGSAILVGCCIKDDR